MEKIMNFEQVKYLATMVRKQVNQLSPSELSEDREGLAQKILNDLNLPSHGGMKDFILGELNSQKSV